MNCKKCGAVISAHNSFCLYCGGGNDPVNMGSINDEEISVSESKAELNTGKQVEEVPLENSPILAITFLIALISGLCVFGSIQYEKAQNNKIQEMSVEDKTVEKKESSASTTVAKKRKNVTADDKNDTKKEKTVKKSRDAEAKSKSTDTTERPNQTSLIDYTTIYKYNIRKRYILRGD